MDLHILQRDAGDQHPAVTSRYLHSDVQAILDAATRGNRLLRLVAQSGPQRPPLAVTDSDRSQA